MPDTASSNVRVVASSAGGTSGILFRAAAVLGVFCVGVWVVLLVQHLSFKTEDPLKSKRLVELKEQLRVSPKNQQIKEEIRELDLVLRRQYFLHLRITDSGSWLLLGGGILFVLLASKAMTLRKRPYFPEGRRIGGEEQGRTAHQARNSIAAIGIIAASALTAIAFSFNTKLPANPLDLQKLDKGPNNKRAAKYNLPSLEEFSRNWPQFRGPSGTGISFDTNPPVNLDGDHLMWKIEVPLNGFNSPIIWDNHVFVSGGDAAQREVFCFRFENGELLWRKQVQVTITTASHVSVPEATGYAAPTMATDGRRAYVIFANYDLAAFTFEGQLLWSKNLGKPQNQYGHASSLITWEDRLIVQLDQGHEDDRLSKLCAFDGQTGEIIWQRPRPVGESWATPLVRQVNGGAQIVTAAAPWVIGYAAADGNELWRFNGLHGEVASSLGMGGGTILAVSAYENVIAIRPDGQGDITKTHLAWNNEDNAPDISTPVATDELVFILSTPGLLTCHDVKSGEKIWEHDFGTEFFASPIVAAGRVYIFSTDGLAVVLEAGRQFREIARAELGEKVSASPAFAQDRIVVRGHQHLFCFGADHKQLALTKVK